jgi:6-phosphogluconolactonase
VMLGAYDPDEHPSQLIRPESGKLILLLDDAAAAKLPDASGSGEPKTGTLELK